MGQDSQAVIADLRARVAIEEAAALCLLASIDLPALLNAANGFIQASEEATRKLLFSTHDDAAHLAAETHRKRWIVSFAEAVAARAESSPG